MRNPTIARPRGRGIRIRRRIAADAGTTFNVKKRGARGRNRRRRGPTPTADLLSTGGLSLNRSGSESPSTESPPQRFDTGPVGPHVVVAKPRCRAHVDHPGRVTEPAFNIVGEPEPGSADGVHVIVRRGEEGGPRPTGQQFLQPGESRRRVVGRCERFDAMAFTCIHPAADTVGTTPTRRQGFAHIVRSRMRGPVGIAPFHWLRDAGPRARQTGACFPVSGSLAAVCRQRP